MLFLSSSALCTVSVLRLARSVSVLSPCSVFWPVPSVLTVSSVPCSARSASALDNTYITTLCFSLSNSPCALCAPTPYPSALCSHFSRSSLAALPTPAPVSALCIRVRPLDPWPAAGTHPFPPRLIPTVGRYSVRQCLPYLSISPVSAPTTRSKNPTFCRFIHLVLLHIASHFALYILPACPLNTHVAVEILPSTNQCPLCYPLHLSSATLPLPPTRLLFLFDWLVPPIIFLVGFLVGPLIMFLVRFLVISGCSWLFLDLFLVVPGYFWLFMVVPGCSWLFLVISGYFWLFLVVHGCS